MGGGHELALWRYAQGSAVLLEFKNTHLAALETMAEQLMLGQLGWVPRRAVGGEVCRRGGCDEALPARADGNGDHVLGEAFLVAHPGVVARRDDVDEGVLHHHFDVHRRVELEEAAQQVRQQEASHRHRHVELEGADRPVGVIVQIIERGADFFERRSQAFQQAFACTGRGDAAGGAVEQAQAQIAFQAAYAIAQRRRRHAAFLSRGAKPSGFDHGGKQRDITQVGLTHGASLNSSTVRLGEQPVHVCLDYQPVLVR